MHKTRLISLALAAVLLVSLSCQPAEQPASTSTSTEADIETLSAVMSNLQTIWNAADLEGTLAYYAEDAVQVPPDEDVRAGKQTLRSNWTTFLEENTDTWTATVEDVQASGDLAFVRGRFTDSSTPKSGGATTTEVGKYLNVFRREADGSWRIIIEIWNEDPSDM